MRPEPPPASPGPLGAALADLRAARAPAAACAAVLLGGVVLAFLPAVRNGWLGFDDDVYVTNNPRVEALTGENLRWMWTDTTTFYWQPLAWMWHAAMRAAVGTDAAAHHAAGLALHAAGTLAVAALVLALLPRPGTGADDAGGPLLRIVAAAGAALLWAVHPLRAEGVAWVAGQKELLSTLFMALAALSWLGVTGPRAGAARGASLVFTALALLVKPMAVMLPAVFLVLDAVPLRRLRAAEDLPALVREKAFHAALCVGALLPSVLDARQRTLLAPGPSEGLFDRIPSVAWSTAFPLVRSFWPQDLSPFYPGAVPGIEVDRGARTLLALLVLGGVTAAVVRAMRRGVAAPAAAWVAYLLLVLPVSGLRQAGAVETADRFAQTPVLALLPLVAALLLQAAGDLRGAGWGSHRAAAALGGGVLVASLALGSMTARYIPAWSDTATLWTRVLASGQPPHPVPLQNLGAALLAEGFGRGDEEAIARARPLFEEALRIDPHHAATLSNMGLLAARAGRDDEALDWYVRAEKADPRIAVAPANRALVLARLGRTEEAREAWRRARARPGALPSALDERLRAALGSPDGTER